MRDHEVIEETAARRDESLMEVERALVQAQEKITRILRDVLPGGFPAAELYEHVRSARHFVQMAEYHATGARHEDAFLAALVESLRERGDNV